ncbi:MAG: ATP-binding protein [Campylobacterota bacterium]
MIGPKNWLSLNYHPKLLEMLIVLTLPGVFIANIMAPLIAAYVLFDFVPHVQIYGWLFLHFGLFFGRVLAAKKLRYFVTIKSDKSTKYLKMIFALTASTALLYGAAIWVSVLDGVSELRIFTVAVIIISLSAGAISTLVSVFHIYVLYVLFSMIPLIGAIAYHGGEMFNVFAFLLSIFTVTILTAGYRQFSVLRNSISLEETFETIYEKSSDGIALIQHNRFKDCNEAIVTMFQYSSKEELLRSHLSNFMPKFQADGSLSVKKMLKMAKTTLQNGTYSFEWLYKRRDGELFWTEVVLTRIYLEGEELIHGTWRDITDRKKLEEQREASKKEIEELNRSLESRVKLEVDKNREKDKKMQQQSRLAQMGEMMSMIAHQWRQPLAAISATSATIELKASFNRLTDDVAMEKAQNISNYSQHLSATIDDFRNFFKPDKEKKVMRYDELIRSVLGIIEAAVVTQNIQLIQELDCRESFSSYPNELKQVILNLVKNAEDVLLEKEIEAPYIKIKTYTEEGQYILEVSDNGEGIEEGIIEHVFDPYFSTKKAKEGTGLGLYMSKTIIEEHCGGTLSVANSDDGAVFKITLGAADG